MSDSPTCATVQTELIDEAVTWKLEQKSKLRESAVMLSIATRRRKRSFH